MPTVISVENLSKTYPSTAPAASLRAGRLGQVSTNSTQRIGTPSQRTRGANGRDILARPGSLVGEGGERVLSGTDGMKIVTIVGARPQFIMAAPVGRVLPTVTSMAGILDTVYVRMEARQDGTF